MYQNKSTLRNTLATLMLPIYFYFMIIYIVYGKQLHHSGMLKDNKLLTFINSFGVLVAHSWFRLDPFIPCFDCERDHPGLGRSISSMFPVRGYNIRDVFASTYNNTIHDASIHIYRHIKYMELEKFGGNCYLYNILIQLTFH